MVKHDVVKSHSLLHLGLVNGDSQYIDEYEGVVIISVDSLSLGHLETRLDGAETWCRYKSSESGQWPNMLP